MGLRSQNRFLLFWSFLGAIAILIIWQLPWRFQVNDDVIMMWLVSGAYTGEPESFAVFIHPILSWSFSKLYSFEPNKNWYGGIWFCVIAISYFLLISQISCWKTGFWAKSAIALLMLSIAIHFSFFPQFTYVAGFGAFASMSYFFSNGRIDSKSYTTILSLLLFIVSAMIRWESVALMGLGFGVFQLCDLCDSAIRSNPRNYFLLGCIFLSIVGFKFLFEINSQYADFLKFNRIRSGVIDHPVFIQKVKENVINEGTDFFYFSRWYFEADSPTIQDLIDKKIALNSELWSVKQFKNSLSRLWIQQKMEAFKSFLIFTFLLFIGLVIKKNPKLLRFFLIWFLVFIIFNHFFLLQGRVVILFFLCFLFPIFQGYFPSIDGRFSKALATVFLFLISVHYYNFKKEANGRLIMDAEFNYLKKSLIKDVPIVMEGFQEHNSEIDYTLNNQVPFLTTGWISRSPFQRKAMNRFGLKSFNDFNEYYLITPTNNLEVVFPSYMNFTFGNFQLIDSTKTDNFNLFHFLRQ
jgi:hypothetical protein